MFVLLDCHYHDVEQFSPLNMTKYFLAFFEHKDLLTHHLSRSRKVRNILKRIDFMIE